MPALTNTQTKASTKSLPVYESILIAADSSDHANHGTHQALDLAGIWNSKFTGIHVYAAKMHDVRFRQMEGGLPPQFRQEQELDRQREVHDDLIGRGLSIITDSYLDQVEKICRDKSVTLHRRSQEGKNYRALADETNRGDYDLLVLGALGLGAISGSRIGTVCERVLRRSNIDTLVIKDTNVNISQGPIVVAVDGSAKSFGGLLTALAMASFWNAKVTVVAAFDPYYHYVAFNRIAGILSEEAGKVFRFQEQEKLHEEIIDSGLAKIYQGHLDVASQIAKDYEIQIETVLLDGKPHDAIEKYVEKIKPSLLVVGKVGIHADEGLDIGGNSENLLRNANCSILFSQREYQPDIDILADVTTSWTIEAEKRMENVPSFVRNMARMAILRYAQERGHTVITASIVQSATRELMPKHAEQAMAEIVFNHERQTQQTGMKNLALDWSQAATNLIGTISDNAIRTNCKNRAEKKARAENAQRVEIKHVESFLSNNSRQTNTFYWQAAALARLNRVPEGFMRDSSKLRIEQHARDEGVTEISFELAERGLDKARKTMQSAMQDPSGESSACPFSSLLSDKTKRENRLSDDSEITDPQSSTQDGLQWSSGAITHLDNIPPGFCRQMTQKAAETLAKSNGITEIDEPFMQEILTTFKFGSESVEETMSWDPVARAKISRAPNFVRGMLIKEIENWAKRNDFPIVTLVAVSNVKDEWRKRGVFHLDPDDPRGNI